MAALAREMRLGGIGCHDRVIIAHCLRLIFDRQSPSRSASTTQFGPHDFAIASADAAD